MAKFRIKNLAAINYILFALWVALAWYYFIPTHHFINTTSDQVNLLKSKFEKNSAIKVAIDIDKTSNTQLWNNILKTPLEEKNKQSKISENILADLNPNLFVNVVCDSKSNTLQVKSLSEYILEVNCNEFEKNKDLQREIKRVISTLTSDLTNDLQLNLAAELYHLNIYVITPHKNRKTANLPAKRLVDVSLPFFEAIGLSQKRYRLNFQTLFLEDLEIKHTTGANGTYGFNIKELDHFMDTFPSISQEQIYTFETENINLFIFADKKAHFFNENTKYNYFDEKKEKYAALAMDPYDQDYEVAILRILYRMFELTSLQDLSNNLQNLKLEYSSDVEFGLFNQRRSKVLLEKIIKGLDSFKYILEDDELIIEKDVGERIDQLLEEISQKNIQSLQVEDLQEIHQIIWTLNFDGNHKYGLRDSFSDDYRIGIYLPILLPFIFPVIKILSRTEKGKKAVRLVLIALIAVTVYLNPEEVNSALVKLMKG